MGGEAIGIGAFEPPVLSTQRNRQLAEPLRQRFAELELHAAARFQSYAEEITNTNKSMKSARHG
jgi:hypothetical protein